MLDFRCRRRCLSRDDKNCRSSAMLSGDADSASDGDNGEDLTLHINSRQRIVVIGTTTDDFNMFLLLVLSLCLLRDVLSTLVSNDTPRDADDRRQ